MLYKMEITKKTIVFNFFWKFAESCGAQVISFVVSIILARILLPDDYGVVAICMIFMNLLMPLVDSGFGVALIQKKVVDDVDFSSVFWINIVFSLCMYIVIWILAPYIAHFYDIEILEKLIRVMGINVIVMGVRNIQQAYASRCMVFKKFFWATFIGALLSAVVGIAMAYLGYGVWAIVAQGIVNNIVGTIVLWYTVAWKPRLLFSFQRVKKLFGYGSKILISGIVDSFYNQLSQILIGKVYTTSDLAFYNRGNSLPSLLVNNINNSLNSVLLPAMSNYQDDREKMRNMTRRALKVSSYVMAPLMMGMAFASDNIIEVLLTHKWMECVPYLCIFCINYMFWPIHTVNLNAIKSMGRSDIFLKLELVKKLVGFSVLIFTFKIGVLAMAIGILVTGIVSQIVNAWPNKKLLNYGYVDQLKDVFPSFTMAFFMGIIIYLLNYLYLDVFVTLCLQIFVGLVSYIFMSYIFEVDVFEYCFLLVKDRYKLMYK